MSHWTYVHGILLADTLWAHDEAETIFIANSVISNSPEITGYERNVEFHINILHDEAMYIGSGKCAQKDTFDVQTYVLVSAYGALRDREFRQTLRETSAFLSRVASRMRIKNCLFRVWDDNNNQFIFGDPEHIVNVDVGDWYFKELERRYKK